MESTESLPEHENKTETYDPHLRLRRPEPEPERERARLPRGERPRTFDVPDRLEDFEPLLRAEPLLLRDVRLSREEEREGALRAGDVLRPL